MAILLAPPAAAISVSILDLTNSQSVQQGGSLLQFRVRVEVSTGERVPFQGLNIILDGTAYQFTPIGGNVTVQTLLKVTAPSNLIYTSNYGYDYGVLTGYGYSSQSGYGWGNGTGYGFAGPRQFTYNVTLDQNQLSTGSHTIRADLVTGTSPISAFSSATVNFTVTAAAGFSQTVATTVSGSSPTVDNTATTGVSVAFLGLTYSPGATQGTVVTQRYSATPSTAITLYAATGRTAAFYVDVRVYNIVSGTATITLTYTDAQVSGLNENTLTLYAYSSGTWTELSSVSRNTAANTVTGSISVTQLTGTIIALAGTPAPSPPPPSPPVLSLVTANIQAERLVVAPGSSVTITLALDSEAPMTTGHLNFTLPRYFRVSKIVTVNFEGTRSLIDRTLRIDKTTTPDTKSATISITLTAPLNSSIRVGETYNVTAEASIRLSTVSFKTPNTITFTIEKPSVEGVFSALDSYFDKTVSIYTENRIPTTKDILNLLDFHFSGRVRPS